MTLSEAIKNKHFELEEQRSSEAFDVHLIAAILMFAVINADGDTDSMEVAHMIDILRSRYALSSNEISSLLAAAKKAKVNDRSIELLATKLTQFWGPREREQLLNDFWTLATADREIKSSERDVIDRIAGRFNLEVDDVTRARFQAEQRLELNIG